MSIRQHITRRDNDRPLPVGLSCMLLIAVLLRVGTVSGMSAPGPEGPRAVPVQRIVGRLNPATMDHRGLLRDQDKFYILGGMAEQRSTVASVLEFDLSASNSADTPCDMPVLKP